MRNIKIVLYLLVVALFAPIDALKAQYSEAYKTSVGSGYAMTEIINTNLSKYEVVYSHEKPYLYPNPLTSGEDLNIQLSKGENSNGYSKLQLNIIDLTGQVLKAYEVEIFDGIVQLPASSLPHQSGMYILKIELRDANFSLPLVIR